MQTPTPDIDSTTLSEVSAIEKEVADLQHRIFTKLEARLNEVYYEVFSEELGPERAQRLLKYWGQHREREIAMLTSDKWQYEDAMEMLRQGHTIYRAAWADAWLAPVFHETMPFWVKYVSKSGPTGFEWDPSHEDIVAEDWRLGKPEDVD